MSQNRLARVNENLRRELAALLIEEPVVESGLVTITNCFISADLKVAEVAVSVIDYQPADDVIAKLNRQQHHWYQRLSDRLPMKRMPRLTFVLDTGLGAELKLEELFSAIEPDIKKSIKKSEDDS